MCPRTIISQKTRELQILFLQKIFEIFFCQFYSRSLRAKVREAMTKDAAMSVLGLKLTTEGKNKKALKLTDYSEDELLIAFRETCAVIGRPILTFFMYNFFQ